MTITLLQACLVGFVYYMASFSLLPVHNFAFAFPLVGGTLTGIIMGDVQTGVQMAVSIQLINMGMIVTGGSMPTDQALAGTVGTALGILLRPTLGDDALTIALSLSVALGMVGNVRYVIRMTVDSIFNHAAEKCVAKGNLRGLFLWNVAAPQLMLMVTGIIPVAAFLMAAGNEAVLAGLNSVLSVIAGPLKGVGMLLPCLGIGLLLNAIGNKKTIPFFIIAFVMSQLMGISVVGMAVMAAMVAFLMTFGKDEPTQATVAAAPADQLPDLE